MLEIVAACTDLEGRRSWAKQVHGIDSTTTGNFWLPVVWTARGPLYAEVITRRSDGRYHQPFHLSDRLKQPLYHFAYNLLTSLSAPPAVYLIQFAPQPSTIGGTDSKGLAFERQSSHQTQEFMTNAKPLRDPSSIPTPNPQPPTLGKGLAFVQQSSHQTQESMTNAKPLRDPPSIPIPNPQPPTPNPPILFDRLIPFPDEPAIASIGVQEPNLFACHWLCLTNQPILDLKIKG